MSNFISSFPYSYNNSTSFSSSSSVIDNSIMILDDTISLLSSSSNDILSISTYTSYSIVVLGRSYSELTSKVLYVTSNIFNNRFNTTNSSVNNSTISLLDDVSPTTFTNLNNEIFVLPNSFSTVSSSSSPSLANEFFNIVNTFNKDSLYPLK